jgi:hypothetical protein
MTKMRMRTKTKGRRGREAKASMRAMTGLGTGAAGMASA